MTTVSINPRLEGLEYRFNLERLAELNRSPVPLLLARLTSACPSHGKTQTEVNDPVALLAEIRRHCADDDDFIRQSMPLQEIVFRTLLLADDQTMTLGDLHYELTERWSSAIRPISITVAGLARILDVDVFYGFEKLPSQEPEIVEADLPMLTAGDNDDSLLDQIFAAIAEDAADETDEVDDPFEEDDEDDPYEEDEEEADD